MLGGLVAFQFRPWTLFEGEPERCVRLMAALGKVDRGIVRFTAVTSVQGFSRSLEPRRSLRFRRLRPDTTARSAEPQIADRAARVSGRRV